MDLKIPLIICLLVVMIASESNAKRNGRRGNGGGKGGDRNRRGRYGSFRKGGGIGRDIKRWCHRFDDVDDVRSECEDIKEDFPAEMTIFFEGKKGSDRRISKGYL